MLDPRKKRHLEGYGDYDVTQAPDSMASLDYEVVMYVL